MLKDNEDRWFEGLEDDSPRSSGCGACIHELTTRRHRGRLCSASRAKAFTLQGRHIRFVGDSAFHTTFRGAPLLFGVTEEVVSSPAPSAEFDSIQLHTIYTIYKLVYPARCT